ncbi:c-type cytochrome [bacterium]|nr:c-type cytochrome [bacterium]
MRSLMLFLILAAMLSLASCPQDKQATDGDAASTAQSGAGDDKSVTPPPPGATSMSQEDLVARGDAIYHGTDYSSTGLTCAHCHAVSPEQEAETKFIAHTGYGAATRGAWKITTQEQLDARSGYAKTLADAANACISAPYMNHPEKLTADDAKAIEAYLQSISKPDAWDSAAFKIARTKDLPAPGLKPDKENGKRIYEQSCEKCHDAGLQGLEELHGAKDWLSPLQIMAKIRKVDNWYEGYEGKSYAAAADSKLLSFLGSLAGSPAMAQENPCGENPCAANPCVEGGSSEAGHAEGKEEVIFPKDSMPFYGTDILTDQEVVDVAFFVAEEV